ncbi:MAG: DUF6179 domain-containing protein [Eubacteriales bacterium]|nr:DUF6179 domain-containing protein [Eubacteriales bacterium]
MEYELEELIPVVAELARKYTSGESTSITYERANHLMEAVLYCIHQCESGNALTGGERLTAQQAYQLGFQKVCEKTKQTQEQYNRMIGEFFGYGNENYEDTVRKAIPGFFRLYNPRFAPQETIITMDYPVLMPPDQYSGIDAIEAYLACVCLEQQFMGAFPEEYVIGILKSYQADYQSQFYNLCRILLRHILGKMMIAECTNSEEDTEVYTVLQVRIGRYSKEEWKERLKKKIHQMILQKWDGNRELEAYLKLDVDDFVSEFMLAAEHHNLDKVIVL